jgi:hypothetical protein
MANQEKTQEQLHLELVTWREFQEKWWERIRGENGEEGHVIAIALRKTDFNGEASHCKEVFLRHLEGEDGVLIANARREAENHLPF